MQNRGIKIIKFKKKKETRRDNRAASNKPIPHSTAVSIRKYMQCTEYQPLYGFTGHEARGGMGSRAGRLIEFKSKSDFFFNRMMKKHINRQIDFHFN